MKTIQSMTSDISDKILNETQQTAIDRSENIWKGSKFEFLVPLSCDDRGRFGEDFFRKLLEEYTEYSVQWDGDSNINPDDGTYDIRVNDLRTEVKTARKGTSSTAGWQHESIKKPDHFDRLALVDLSPDNTIHITVIKNTEMVYGSRHPVFGRKSTRCKDGWKFDTSTLTLGRGIAAGLTYHFNLENPNDTKLSEFLVRHFSYEK